MTRRPDLPVNAARREREVTAAYERRRTLEKFRRCQEIARLLRWNLREMLVASKKAPLN